MDPILLHLRVNHLAIFTLPIAALLLAFALWRRESRDLWLVAAAVMTIAFAGGSAAYKTGGDAEHQDDRIPHATHDMIEAHEQQANPAMWATTVATALAWVCFAVARKRRLPLALGGAAIAATLLSSVLMFRLGNAGGKVGHPEIRGAAPPASEHDHERDHGDGHADHPH